MATALCGCYEDFCPDVDIKPVLCMNSLITTGNPIDVKVTRTRLYTDDNLADYTVADAVVSIYVDGKLADQDYIPCEGDNIRIVAESKVYGMAEAEVTVPYAVPAKSLKYVPVLTDSWQTEFSDGTKTGKLWFNLSVDMEIEDPRSEDNYYRLSMIGFNDGREEEDSESYSKFVSFYPGEFKYEAEPIFSEHIGVFESVLGNSSYGVTFFTDRQFSGKNYTLHLAFENGSYRMTMYNGWNPELFECGIEVALHTVSKSYYNWMNYLWQRDEGFLGDLSDIGLADPIWGYSNVSTGAGVVAAQSYKVYTINLKEFIEDVFSVKKYADN